MAAITPNEVWTWPKILVTAISLLSCGAILLAVAIGAQHTYFSTAFVEEVRDKDGHMVERRIMPGDVFKQQQEVIALLKQATIVLEEGLATRPADVLERLSVKIEKLELEIARLAARRD